jgi:hypothetical protein
MIRRCFYMDEKLKERSLVYRTKELGIYNQGMKRGEIKKAQYWIDKCGSYEEYMKAKCFAAEIQDIHCEHALRPSEKRKPAFAESKQQKKKKAKQDPHKKPLVRMSS